jgi:pseudomonalisin
VFRLASFILFFIIAAPIPSLAQGWAATATRGLGSLLANATPIGLLPGSTPLHIAVALQVNNKDALVQYVKAVSDPTSALYGNSLTVSQFVSAYAPTGPQAQAVVNYLASQGLANIQLEPNNLFVTADGTAAQLASAFNTTMGEFQQGGKTIYVNMTDAQVPSSLAGTVIAVLGLNNAGRMSPPIRKQTVSSVVTPAVHFYPPQGFWTAYDVGSTPTGSNTAIAIFAQGDLTQVLTDLSIAEAANQLPQVPVQVEQVGLASPDTAGQAEWDLDTQMSTGMAGSVAKLIIYDTTSLADSDVALMFNKFAQQNIAKAGSASFGLCETFAFLDGSMLADDQVFLEAAAQGQTVFASTGDNGSACPVVPLNGAPLSGAAGMVLYPASSPYVVGVGGTTLLTSSGYDYIVEVGWNAGGGGVSAWELSPYWQQPVLPTTAAGKAIPDVSIDADIVSGALVYIGCNPGQDPQATCQQIIGGTSLSSPLWLGVWARLQSAHSNNLGFASPKLYQLYQKPPSPYPGYHDIVGGCNGLFCAIPGFDYVTGLGTPDVDQLNTAIK